MNTDAPGLRLIEAEVRVLGIQTKLHQWAVDDGGQVVDLASSTLSPIMPSSGWVGSVRGNRGARSGGSMAWHHVPSSPASERSSPG